MYQPSKREKGISTCDGLDFSIVTAYTEECFGSLNVYLPF